MTTIIFIDFRVAGIQRALVGVPPGAEVVVLDAASDGLAQIAACLAGHAAVDAVHIVSHGSRGSLLLGSSTVDAGSLASQAAALATIRASLLPTAEILLYGCDVADGDAGARFVGLLAAATAADVAASTDTTGAAGSGGDTVLEASSGSVATAALGLASGLAQTLAVINGGAGNDSLPGTASADTINGLAGNDTLSGLGGNDTLDGGTGNDSMVGGTGNDSMAGGTGNDRYVVDSSGDVVSESSTLATEIDTVSASQTFSLGANVERLTLTGNGSINGTGNGLANQIVGNAGANVLTGGPGADTIVGGSANDTLGGASGNDSLDGGVGTDSMNGGTGNDTYIVDASTDIATESGTLATEIDAVFSSVDFTLGANIERLTLTGAAAIDAGGNRLANLVTGNTGANRLSGAVGNDTLDGGDGNDTLGGGIDNDSLKGGAGADSLGGSEGADTLDGGSGNDTLAGGTGNDSYFVDADGDQVSETSTAAAEVDSVRSSVSFTLGAYLERLTLGGANATNGSGNGLANTITGNAAANSLTGGGGNDTLDGGRGDDTLTGGTGVDSLTGGAGSDSYGVDSAGDAVVETGTLAGEIDTVTSSVSWVLDETLEALTLSGTAATFGTGNALANLMNGNRAANILTGDDGKDTLNGGAGRDSLNGGAGDDRLDGGADDDMLAGGGGNDVLDGAVGGDTMDGGAGSDVYVVDAVGDVVDDSGTVVGEIDTVRSAIDYTLGASLENLALQGSGLLLGTGNARANLLVGNSGDNILSGEAGDDTVNGGAGGNDTLFGGAGNDGLVGGTGNDTLDGGADDDTLSGGSGNDSLTGGAGNDTYIVGAAGDKVVEADSAGGAADVVQSGISWALGANLERLTLLGASAINGTGNDLANLLTGNGAANTLSGGGGADTLDGGDGADLLVGGTGADLYIVESATDAIDEAAANGGEIDTVDATVSRTLGANLEVLNLFGSGAIDGTGNGLANTINGNGAVNAINGLGGDDTIDGGGGADLLAGGAGNDEYLAVQAGDTIVENTGEGVDTVATALATYTLGANVDKLVATGAADFAGTGNTLDNEISGGAGDDTLDGRAGADSLAGGAGDDTYIVDDAGEVLEELAAAGEDRVQTTLADWTLADNFEGLTFTGVGSFAGTGNAAENALTGGAGDDTLDGSTGDDTLAGGAGNDVYGVDSADDDLVEAAGGGTDVVRSTVSWALGADFEWLELLPGAGAANGTGNAQDNVISGTDAVNTLGGGDGNDTLTGLAGSDVLVGGDGNDSLAGGAGGDDMSGGAGDDTYEVDDSGDMVTEEAASGGDTVRASINYILGSDVERLFLVGTATSGVGNGLDNEIRGNGLANALSGLVGNDALEGNAGNDTLDGGTGDDLMLGGTGDDLYVVDSAFDTVGESTGSGTDTVQTTLASYLLDSDVEKLGYGGAVAFAGTGNALANTISGGAGNDTLDGGILDDTLVGGAGNDVYKVDDAGDVTTEAAAGGTDRVDTVLASWTLAAEVENLSYTGAGNFTGTGNASVNTITGGAGNDSLGGGVGVDTMIGGAGNDVYTIDGNDSVTEAVGGGTDTMQSSASDVVMAANVEIGLVTGALNLNVKGSLIDNTITGNGAANGLDGNDGNDSIVGGAGIDKLTGGAGNDTLNGGTGNDSMEGGAGDDVYYVDSNSDSLSEGGNGGTDTVNAVVDWTLAPDFERLTLVGGAVIDGTGNGAANIITGNGQGNIVSGLGGNDTISGGDGGDLITGGAGNDLLTGGTGVDYFVFDSLASDAITDFVSRTDKLQFSMSGISIGDGDNIAEYKIARPAPGGYVAANEVVIFTTDIASLTTANAAAAIGPSGDIPAIGHKQLFVVDTGTVTGIYLFTASTLLPGTGIPDNIVLASELALLATLGATPATVAADYLFGG